MNEYSIFSSNLPYSEIGFFDRAVGGAEMNLWAIAEELAKINYNDCYLIR